MAKNNNGKQIFVERETFEKNGRTFFSYFIKGVIRGKRSARQRRLYRAGYRVRQRNVGGTHPEAV